MVFDPVELLGTSFARSNRDCDARSTRLEKKSELGSLATLVVCSRPRRDGALVCLRRRLRTRLKGTAMTLLILTALVTLLLFVYLLVALLRPEWF
jgi:K+-transporting ATPase KdpF subunit